MEDYAVNGAAAAAAADQVAPDLAAAVQAAAAGATATLADLHHAMPLVAFDPQSVTTPEEAEAAAAAIAAAAGAMVGQDMSPGGMHMSGGAGGLAGRGRLSAGSFKNRTGPQYCQVEGCGMPLEGLKEYHQRYKVCEEHLKIPYIIKDGQQVRFCQQCGRFQPLDEFDDNKRSCRVRLQRHNARRRKRPRDAGGSMGDGHMSEYGTSAAAAEMAKLAAQSYAAVGGLAAPNAAPICPKDVQAMHDALHFASTTLNHSNQVVKPAGEEGGEEGGEAAGSGMGPNSMPFVPTPDVMMLLLKGYAAMFHYVLDSATIRALAPPSDLPDQQAAAGTLGALDALQMQQLMQAQGLFGASGGGIGGMGGLPMLLAGGEMAAAGMLVAAQGQEVGGGGGGEGEAVGDEGGGEGGGELEGGEGHEQQLEQQHAQQHELGAEVHDHDAQHAQQAQQAGHADELTAEQVASAMIHPLPSDAAAAEGAMAAAAALAAAAGGHYMGLEAAGQQQMDQGALEAAAALDAHHQGAADAAALAMAQQAQQGQELAQQGGVEEAQGAAGGSADEGGDAMQQ